jgi:hypothetical protein
MRVLYGPNGQARRFTRSTGGDCQERRELAVMGDPLTYGEGNSDVPYLTNRPGTTIVYQVAGV